jgi:lysophospholipase L1-like esterase
MKSPSTLGKILLLAASIAAQSALAQSSPAQSSRAQLAQLWIGSWAASQQIPEPANALATDDLRDATLRQIVHLSAGGTALRVHLSNAFGTEPLHITSAHIAKPLSPAAAKIDPATDRPLTFDGSPDVIIPAGAKYISDPIPMPVAPLSDLAITLHLDTPPAVETGHPGSRATSYLAHGDLVSAPDLPDAKKVDHWYMLAGVDVATPGSAVVTLGDSTTDGHGATTNGNDRWPDVLAQRLQASPDTTGSPASSLVGVNTRNIGVLNHGIGGNHLLTDGAGPNVLARFDPDVLAQPGVRTVIVFEGINDLGGLTREHEASPDEHALLVKRILGAYQQIIQRAHAQGIKVIGATITPFMGSGYYHPGPANEADRQAVNEWIRTAGHFDAVIDFDKVIRDPAHPDRLLPAYDSGDHLHPGPAGYRAMGEAVPLALLK